MQYNQVVGQNFGVVIAELEEYIKEGWSVDFSNYPIDSFTQYVIHIQKPDARDEVKKVFAEPAKKPAGRPAKEKA